MRRIKFSFKPEKKGLKKFLGELEEKILNVLWEGKKLTGREVFEKVSKEKKVAYTTVLTVLQRMVKKGLVDKKKKDEIYLYSATLDKEEFTKYIYERVLKGVLDFSESATIAFLIDILSDYDPKTLEQLSSIIEKKKKELRKK